MNNHFDGYPAILNADQLAEILDISRTSAYQLVHQEGLYIGKRMLVPKDKLIAWIDHNTGGRYV